MKNINYPLIVSHVLEDYALPHYGTHGISHWARVWENGLKLASLTGAEPDVVRLFALCHDSQRRNEGWDPNHGPRAADFVISCQGRLFQLPKESLNKLRCACRWHTDAETHPDITVKTCWDADRLDLARVGTTPDPIRLCTDAARDAKMIRWASGRAADFLMPGMIREEWGLKDGGSTQ